MEMYGLAHVGDMRGNISKGDIDYISWLGLQDLYFFGAVILGYGRFGLTGFHFEMCDFIEGGVAQSRAGTEWHGFNNVPREHFKTTFAITRGVQRIAEDPDGCQLITSATLKQAVATSQAMKWHIEKNEVFQRFYPYVIPDGTQWKLEEWRIMPRSKGKPRRRESTVMSIPVGGTPEGFHFEWLTQDDLVTRKNSRSRTRQEEVIEFFQLSQALLNEGGEELINGTRFEDDDLYGWLEDEENETAVVTFKRAVEETDEETGESHFIFPEEWNDERLNNKRKNMNLSNFFCQYYNDPMPTELQQFRPDFFHYFKKASGEWSIYIGCDPTTGMAKDNRGDKCGIVLGGMDDARTFHVMETITELWREQQIIICLDELNAEYNVIATRIETYGQAKSMLGAIEVFQEESGRFWPVEGSSGSKESKVPRIIGLLQPLYERRKIFHQSHMRGGRLEYQLTRLGVTGVNDLADALYQMISAALEGGYWGSHDIVAVPKNLREKVLAGHPLNADERVRFAPTIQTAHILHDDGEGDDYLE